MDRVAHKTLHWQRGVGYALTELFSIKQRYDSFEALGKFGIANHFYFVLIFFKALWVHRRFLFQCWIKHFTTKKEVLLDSEDHLVSSTTQTFLAGELHFVKSFFNISSDEFHDTQDQAQYAASYILWILKVMLLSSYVEELYLKLY